jgi:hypothetical protein
MFPLKRRILPRLVFPGRLKLGGVDHGKRILCNDLVPIIGFATRLRGSLAQVLDTHQRTGPGVLGLELGLEVTCQPQAPQRPAFGLHHQHVGNRLTVVSSVSVLLSGFSSVSVLVTATLFVIVPVVVGLTTIVTVAPRRWERRCPGLHHPAFAIWIWRLATCGSSVAKYSNSNRWTKMYPPPTLRRKTRSAA